MIDIIQPYIVAGFKLVPIPPGSKGPGRGQSGWQTRAAAIKDASDPNQLPVGWGVGLMHAYSGTMAFDIDDWVETKKYGIDVDALYAAPDAVTIISGVSGRGKLLYRMPFGMVFETRQYKIKVPGGPTSGHTKDHTVFELRCGTSGGTTVQDVLPPTIHPETCEPYQWGGAGHWSRLPMIPPQLLKVWSDLSVVRRVTPNPVEDVGSSWDDVIEALRYINPDCSRDTWRDVGMALRWKGDQAGQADYAFALWDEWSKGAPHRYPTGRNEIQKQWHSFRSANKTTLITLSTLFHYARESGWVRPMPDVSSLFQGVVPTAPADIMQMFRPQLPDPDLSLWPPVLAERAQELSDTVGCDPLVPLWAGLAAACGAVDARCRLELAPGFQVPPVLWLMTVGDPAAKKTPGSRPMLDPLKHIEVADKPRYKQELMLWEAKEIMYSQAKTKWDAFMATPDAMMDITQAPTVPELPPVPVPVKIRVMDITSQALVRSAADRPRGLLCHLDEMSSWIAKLVSKNSGEDRSAWVVSYESDRYEMERVGAGRVSAENLAVSIYGNVQPRVLKDNFTALAADGLLQRFLPVVLRNDRDKLGNPVPDCLTQGAQWDTTLRAIFALPPITYRMSNEAYSAFRKFQMWYQDEKQNERLLRASDTFLTAFGKIEGLTGRLILMFHVIENPYSPTVSPDIVERVVRIVRKHVIPTYRHLLDDNGSMSSFDSWLVDHVIHYADRPRLTMSEIKRSARRQWEICHVDHPLMQNQWVMNGMHHLEQRNWVRRTDDGTQEHRGFAEWQINPGLVTAFSDYRLAVIKAKAARLREMDTDNAMTKLKRVHGADEIE